MNTFADIHEAKPNQNKVQKFTTFFILSDQIYLFEYFTDE